jgi:hypothetical protein
MKKIFYFLFLTSILTSCNFGSDMSEWEEGLKVMKQKEWVFNKEEGNGSFTDAVKLKFTNDSTFTLTIESKYCGNLVAEGRYYIKQINLKEDFAASEKLEEKLDPGSVLKMETKWISVNGDKNSKFIDNTLRNLEAEPSYNMIQGYFYATDKGTYKDIILSGAEGQILTLQIPEIYATYKSYGDVLPKFNWSVTKLKPIK